MKINVETYYLWRAVDHEGEVLESYVTKRRDRKVALKFLRKTMKHFGPPHVIVTDLLRSYGAAMKVIGNTEKTGNWPLAQQLGREFTLAIPRKRSDTLALLRRNEWITINAPRHKLTQSMWAILFQT